MTSNQVEKNVQRPAFSQRSHSTICLLALILFANCTFFTMLECYAQSIESKLTITGHSGSVESIAYSPDGRMLATGSTDKTVKLWDSQTGKLIRTMMGNKGAVIALAFSPDSKILASASKTNDVILWDVDDGKLKKTLKAKGDGPYTLQFLPTSDRLLLWADSWKINQLWDAGSGQLLQTNTNSDSGLVVPMTQTPDGKLEEIPTSGPIVAKMPKYDRSGVLSPDKKWGVSRNTNEGNSVMLIDMHSPKESKANVALIGHNKPSRCFAFSPDGKTLASGSEDKTVKLWNISDLK